MKEYKGNELSTTVGKVFQDFALFNNMSVLDNLVKPQMKVLGVPKEQAIDEAMKMLAKVSMESHANKLPDELSGGQKQRVAIARALANDPYLLLCDEATSALDPATTQSILQLLKDINQRLGITILLITHEMDVIKTICNHVAVIDQGKLIAKGTLEEIISKKEHPIIKEFTKSKTMNIPLLFNSKLVNEPSEGLFPLVEIELTGNIAFERLLSIIYADYKIPYQLIHADVEFLGNVNFGKLLLHLQGSSDQNAKAIAYFNHNNIQNTIKGYA